MISSLISSPISGLMASVAGVLPATRVTAGFTALRIPLFTAQWPPLLPAARIAVPRVLFRAAGLARRRAARLGAALCTGLSADGLPSLAAVLTRRANAAFAVFARSMRRAIRGFFRRSFRSLLLPLLPRLLLELLLQLGQLFETHAVSCKNDA
ncbi:hypothetical protein [Paraburkholderia sp. SARCC-3016]|uniref:hypothetical protein n=1 Tax=Paraburkholderia sp. SARCC-3016 TaxID=3058611 RepID=UPI00280AC272|nr:hypothetical protein [Paraburkholderia sp. SARCC-3016]